MTRRTKIKVGLFAVVAVIVVALAVGLAGRVDWQELRSTMEHMDRAPLLLCMAVLPIFGFSISIVYLVVGAVFGGWIGLAVVTAITAFHLVGSHWIARSFLHAP